VELAALKSNFSEITKSLTRVYAAAQRHKRGGPPRPAPMQHQGRLTAREIADLGERYRAGATIVQLARDFHVHRVTISAVLSKQGIPTRSRGLGPDQVLEAARLYEKEGWSLARLGDRYHVDGMTVRAAFLRGGMPLRRPWERT
jgi:hypothetical protein